ncbi:hypothetical protein [Pseudomonas umsongensis]|uniref:hypothetical protein n=1 Tax=Pseudomonas umsongensis TaxID=198618 RepID=UPI00200A4716|nr:hypothetical protein [Pseudomonas umsongensis]MCK8657436.1 hypothetical protein [Pseudomonas umsongensis]
MSIELEHWVNIHPGKKRKAWNILCNANTTLSEVVYTDRPERACAYPAALIIENWAKQIRSQASTDWLPCNVVCPPAASGKRGLIAVLHGPWPAVRFYRRAEFWPGYQFVRLPQVPESIIVDLEFMQKKSK